MKGRIFMYLFLFAVLYIIFQFVNSKKGLEKQEKEIADLTTEVETFRTHNDSITTLLDKSSRFSLQNNDKARMYIEDFGYNVYDFEKILENQIFSKNAVDSDNPLVPYSGMAGMMRINSMKVLNHRWIIAEFTDGTYWGEVLLSYFINDDKTITLEVIDSFLFAN